MAGGRLIAGVSPRVVPRYLTRARARGGRRPVGKGEKIMVKTKFGYLHVHYGPDMDGSSRTFEWVENQPQSFGLSDEDAASYAAEYGEEVAGWFAMCEVEPEMGWVGPFETEEEAVKVATDEDALHAWEVSRMGDDPMGDWHGRNA